MNYWITTQWPYEEADGSRKRHLYFRTGKRKNVPAPGDIVFIYESEYAKVAGKVIDRAYRVRNGVRTLESVPRGRCAIIAQVTVADLPRSIAPSDVVHDYGDLGSWTFIPCRNQKDIAPIPKGEMMKILGYPATTTPRFLSLWRIKDKTTAERLLKRVG